MRARFFSDISLENFTDEAFAIHEVEVLSTAGNRDVKIEGAENLTVELTALIQLNGGQVLNEDTE